MNRYLIKSLIGGVMRTSLLEAKNLKDLHDNVIDGDYDMLAWEKIEKEETDGQVNS